MATAFGNTVYRPELASAFRRGEAHLVSAITEQGKLFRAGDRLVGAGDCDQRIYFLRTGWLCRTRHLSNDRRQILTLYLPGDLVGTKSLLLARQPDAIDSLTTSTVHILEQARLRALVTRDGDVALRVIWQIVEEERRLHNWVTALGQGTAKQRVAAMLLELHVRLRRLNLASTDSFRLPLTQNDISDHVGLSVVHVNRVLRDLQQASIATVRSGLAVISNFTALVELAHPLLDPHERYAITAEEPITE